MRISDWSSDVCSSDLHDLELAPDHAVERARVALDVDALDEDLGTLLDIVDDIDGEVVAVALHARPDVDEGIAEVADGIGQRLDGRVHLAGVIPLAFLRRHLAAQHLRLEIAPPRLQPDLADAVARALFHRARKDAV